MKPKLKPDKTTHLRFKYIASVIQFFKSFWNDLADHPPQVFDRISGTQYKFRPDPLSKALL